MEVLAESLPHFGADGDNAGRKMGIMRRLTGGRGDIDMTQGNIARHLIEFAIPLLIGNIFQ